MKEGCEGAVMPTAAHQVEAHRQALDDPAVHDVPACSHATRYDTIRYDTTRHDTTRHDTTRHDTTRHDTTRHDTTQHVCAPGIITQHLLMQVSRESSAAFDNNSPCDGIEE
jgi:hypothetical protein